MEVVSPAPFTSPAEVRKPRFNRHVGHNPPAVPGPTGDSHCLHDRADWFSIDGSPVSSCAEGSFQEPDPGADLRFIRHRVGNLIPQKFSKPPAHAMDREANRSLLCAKVNRNRAVGDIAAFLLQKRLETLKQTRLSGQPKLLRELGLHSLEQ
jgi:hypothetical protein